MQRADGEEMNDDRQDQEYPGTLHDDRVQRPVRVVEETAVTFGNAIVTDYLDGF